MKSTWTACAPHASPIRDAFICTINTYMHTCAWHAPPITGAYIYAPFTHTCTSKHICVHRCTIYTYVQHMNTCSPHASLNSYVHHQTPPKIKIYLVSIPSALYERPGQNERYVLNSAVLLLFIWKVHFSQKCRCFSQKVHVLFTKSACFSCAFQKTTCKEL